MRGWVADCLRGLEFLLSRPEVDRSRIAGVGFNDLSLLTAALSTGLCCVTSVPGLFHRTKQLQSLWRDYPLAEYTDYLRVHSELAESFHQSLNYFDPRWFAERIRIPCLLWGDSPLTLLPVSELKSLAESIGQSADLRASTASRSQDGIAQEHWLAEQLGLSVPVLPEHWQ